MTERREDSARTYRMQKPYKEERVYTKKRVLINWDGTDIGRKCKAINYAVYEKRRGEHVMENQRSFGFGPCIESMRICFLAVPGCKEWFKDQSDGVDPEEIGPKGIPHMAYRLYQRVYNSLYNPAGKKEDGTIASRSQEHPMHPSKKFLKELLPWAREQVRKYGDRVKD